MPVDVLRLICLSKRIKVFCRARRRNCRTIVQGTKKVYIWTIKNSYYRKSLLNLMVVTGECDVTVSEIRNSLIFMAPWGLPEKKSILQRKTLLDTVSVLLAISLFLKLVCTVYTVQLYLD